ncbi:MAG TPA: AAA family ATPase, partial [Roseiarcus sp.]|nr:AAA family ATPase [Roseiarcus sp.]
MRSCRLDRAFGWARSRRHAPGHPRLSGRLLGRGGAVRRIRCEVHGRRRSRLFRLPRAHEDDAARAVHAGLEIADVVASLQTRAREKLAVRVGIATGLVVVGDLVGQGSAQEQAVVGDTPNLAARLQGLAEAGGVVVSASTRRLIGDQFRLKELGKHAVKGLAEPVEAYAALGVSQSESRFEAAHAARLAGFVGREAESAELRARQRRAWGGEGQIVLISGDAGIGKSRLAAWLAEQVAETTHTRLRYQCSPYHRDSALYPFVQQLERAAGIAPQEPAEAKLDKLEKVLGLATDRIGEVAPLIAAMLSIPTGARYPPLNLSPAQQRRQTLSALLDQMEGLAKKQPVLMLFEDAHWADATSLEVLDLAIERVRRLPVLFLITFRPEFEAPWNGLPDVETIALGRLDRPEAERLVESVTGGRKLPAEVLAQVVAKTDGVPLFVEELTKNVLESGLLVEEAEGFRLDGPLPPLAIPSTLQDSLMARLDRLATVKEIAQIGAAIGREFSYPLLNAVVGRDEATLRVALTQLEDSGLVFRSSEPPAARYTFKHALVQDTAYESLLKSRRQILHQKIAETLREKFADVVEAEPELLAHHFTQAGLTAPAIEYWGKAGDLALRRSAFKEAIAHLGKAIEMTEAGGGSAQPRDAAATASASQRLKLQTDYGQAMTLLRGFGSEESKAAFTRARELAAGIDNAAERFAAYYGQWIGSIIRGETRMSWDIAAAFLGEAEDKGRLMEIAAARRCVGLSCFAMGNFADARRYFDQALTDNDAERDADARFRFIHDTEAVAKMTLALVIWHLGDIGRARQLMGEALRRTIELGHAPTTASVNVYRGLLETVRGDAQATLNAAEVLVQLGKEHGMALYLAVGELFSCWARGRLIDPKNGAIEYRDALKNYMDQGNKYFAPFNKGLLAELDAGAGDLRSALTRVDEGLALAQETDQQWSDVFLYRLRGEILLKQDARNSTPAAEAFQTAVAIAQQQNARSFGLRAALSLAKLYRSTGRDADAHAVLGPALEGFSPTPEFPEIAEAKALFDALAETGAVKAASEARKRHISLQVSYGNAMFAARGFAAPETTAAFERARELAFTDADAAERFSINYGLWAGSYVRGELGAMRELSEAFLRDCASRPNSPEAGVA